MQSPEHVDDDMSLDGMLDDGAGRRQALLVRQNDEVEARPLGRPEIPWPSAMSTNIMTRKLKANVNRRE